MNHDPLHNPDTRLSPAGQARKHAMLAPLQREVVARGRRRRAARAAILATPALAFVVAGVLVLRSTVLPGPHSTPRPIAESPALPELISPRAIASDPGDRDDTASSQTLTDSLAHAPHLAVPARTIDPGWALIPRARTDTPSVIRPANGDPGLLARSQYRGEAAVRSVTDAELAVALRAAGRAAGVARTPTGVQIIADQARQPG